MAGQDQEAHRPSVQAVEAGGFRYETPLEAEIDGAYRRGGIVIAIDLEKRDLAWAQVIYPATADGEDDIFITALEITGNGKSLAIGCDDGAAYLLDLETCAVSRV